MFKDLFEKINFMRFFAFSIPLALGCMAVLNNRDEWLAFGVIYVATVIYLLMFALFVYELIRPHRIKDYKLYKKNLVFLFIGKLLILIGAILFGVQILESKIIIPVINYFLNIFVLGVSIKKD